MIRKLQESDRDNVLKYLYVSPSLNIFIIGDIEAFGFDKDFQSTYGEFDEQNNYISVMLFYRDNVVFYSHIDHFNEAWIQVLYANEFKYFSGRKTLMDLIYPHLEGFEYKEMYFAEAKELLVNIEDHDLDIKTLKTKEDAAKVYELLNEITEFGVSSQGKDYFVEGKMKGIEMGVTYYIEENSHAISSVAATAETTKNAMVIGVATLLSARKKGYASILMTHLLDVYLKKGKYLCLFYDNPKAGVIYKRLGFKDTEKWVMIDKR